MYHLNEEKMFHDVVDNVAIVIDFSTGVYFGFNTFGTAVLDAALAGGTAEEIASAVRNQNNCPENIIGIITDFLCGLVENQILLSDDDKGSPVEIPAQASRDGFIPTFERFSEVQDLILADPIHEVDPEQGWPAPK